MKPCVDITALDRTDGYETVKRTIIESGFSRLPVYEEDIDNIRGTLCVKDLMPYINHGDGFDWQSLVRKPYFVPEHKKINDLLGDFQSNKGTHGHCRRRIPVRRSGWCRWKISSRKSWAEISDESDNDEKLYTRLERNAICSKAKPTSAISNAS